ncbi:MAG: large conductance mechanosensitive channel protein MscL [Chloroflexota bacterium]
MPSERNDERASGATGVARRVGKPLGGFKKFLLRGNVVDLAVGIVIGAAFTGVVQALVKDIINPLIGPFSGSGDLSSWAVSAGPSRLLVGDFLSAVLSFLIVALVVYFLVVVPVGHLMDRYRSEPAPAQTKECPECLSKIPELARRCSQCTAQIAPPSEAVAAAMRSVAAPSGEHVADEAARVLVQRLQGSNGSGHRTDLGSHSVPGK